MKISKNICINIILVSLYITSWDAYAWSCGQYKGLPSDMIDVSCDRQYQGNEVRLDCSVSFKVNDADQIYNVGIYLKNSKGQKFKADGSWAGGWNYGVRFENANLSSNVEQFKTQFIVEKKNGDKYFTSRWFSCK